MLSVLVLAGIGYAGLVAGARLALTPYVRHHANLYLRCYYCSYLFSMSGFLTSRASMHRTSIRTCFGPPSVDESILTKAVWIMSAVWPVTVVVEMASFCVVGMIEVLDELLYRWLNYRRIKELQTYIQVHRSMYGERS